VAGVATVHSSKGVGGRAAEGVELTPRDPMPIRSDPATNGADDLRAIHRSAAARGADRIDVSLPVSYP
jgi:hypothetical protein